MHSWLGIRIGTASGGPGDPGCIPLIPLLRNTLQLQMPAELRVVAVCCGRNIAAKVQIMLSPHFPISIGIESQTTRMTIFLQEPSGFGGLHTHYSPFWGYLLGSRM